ncbi:Cytochrome P450, E-class, group I [Fusarium oxysporum f. sp. vasinfectum]|nr:Cytochrome P450, E-class, group I [Fusarium oxysporum f. sp. vasinfectum]
MANTVPAALWMIVHILLDASLLRRVRHQISPAFQSTEVGEQPDIKVLMKDPLLNSIYYETLRLRVASTVGRTSLDDQLCLAGGWKIKAGVPVMFTGWLAGLDESCWNTVQDLSGGRPQHPLEAFWAERFLDCPGSSSISGPAKKKRVQPARESPQRPTTHMGTEDERSRASVAGLRGHFFPFGGGAFRCPGEAMAKQVIFASVAMVLQSYDLRLIDPEEARKIEPGHRELPFGLHSFDRPVPVEICKLSET